MSDDESGGGVSRKSIGGSSNAVSVSRNGEPTQRFSALQQQLLCAAIHFFHRHIRSDADVLQRMEGNQMFKLFFEVQYHNNKPDLNRIFPESVHDCSALHVCSFILSILHQGIFSVSAFIVSVIYLSRFKESSHITLHACTWRPLFLTSLLLADKMWEDKPVRNSSLAKLFPVLNNTELNRMEGEFLGEIRFNVLVKPDLFCSFCEKLLAEQVHQEISRCVSTSEYAATLQADHVDMAPIKQADNSNYYSSSNNGVEKVQSQPLPTSEPTSFENRFDAAKHQSKLPFGQLGSGRAQRSGSTSGRQTTASNAWMEPSGPRPSPTSGVAHSAHDTGTIPRSQSAGPVAGSGSRRNEPTRAEPRPQPLHTLVSWRGSGANSTTSPSKSSSTPQPPRSVSVHLHRNESTKKSPTGKAEDAPEKTGRPGLGQQPHPVAHQNPSLPLRRSLPAKTSHSAYTPLTRATSSGGSSLGGGISRTGDSSVGPIGQIGIGGGTSGGSGSPAVSSGAPMIEIGSSGGATGGGSAAGVLGSGLRQPLQTSPRSPGGGSPLLLPHDQPSSRWDREPSLTNSGGVSQPGSQSVQPIQQMSLHSPPGPSSSSHGYSVRGQATRVATPPVPASHGSGQASASARRSQDSKGGLTRLPARCVSPGHGSGMQGVGGVQPTRASSAPRVSGMNNQTPTGSTVRTTSQPMPSGGPYMRHPGNHAPGSPNSSMVGASTAMNSTRGDRSSMAAKSRATSSQGSVGGNMGMHRNPSPMGVATPASPAGNVSMGQMSFGGGSVISGGQRQDLLSNTRGRSPPPAISNHGSGPSTVRQPRAVTPGALVKGLAQSIHGQNVQRNSLGPNLIVHRGIF